MSVAVVDIEKVFTDLDEKATIEAEITAQTEQLQKLEQKKQTEINALQADMEILSPESDAFKQTKDNLEKKLIELQVWRQVKKRQLEGEKTLRIEGLYRKTLEAVARVAKNSGYDLVLFKDKVANLRGQNQQQLAALIQVRKVLYAADDLDITDRISQMLNNEYNNRAKKNG